MTGTLVQVSVSKGGMPKLAVEVGKVTKAGVEGDWQKNRKYHGGPGRAICLFSEELYAWLAEKGIEMKAGSVGENFTTRGIDLLKLGKGDRLKVGGCTIEITDVRVPCRSLKMWGAELPELIVGKSGWVASVVEEGEVRAGDGVVVVGGKSG